MPTTDWLKTRAAPSADLSISPYAWLVAAVLSMALVGLNHDFDVVGELFEETSSSGGKLEIQARFEKSVANSDVLRQAGFGLLLATCCLASIGPKQGATIRVNGGAVLAAAALAWAVVSWFWSIDGNETLRELIRLLVFAATSVLLVRRFRVHELVFLFLVACLTSIVVACAADVAAGTFQPWNADFRLGGSLHPNQMARLATFVALIGYAATWEGRYRRIAWLLVAGGAVVVVMTYSRSGLVGLLAGMMAIHFVGLAGRRLAFHASGMLAILAGCVLVLAAMPVAIQREMTQTVLMGRTEGVSSLTGRLPLWQEIWRDAAQRPFAGHGYGAYWTTERISEIGDVINWYPRHSHSAYMELLMDLGFVGLLLVVALALWSLVQHSQLAAATGRFEYRFLGAVFVAGFVNGILEVAFISPRFEGMLAGIAVLVLFLRRSEPAVRLADDAHAVPFEAWRTLTTARPSPAL